MAEVWNAANPQTSNSVAADVADIQENFSYLEDLLTNHYKTWSASSTDIGKDSLYFCDPTAADQGATANARSLKSIYDTIGTSKNVIIYMPHQSSAGNSTTYTVTTALTLTSNYTLLIENGGIIAGAGALTLNGNAVVLGNLTVSGELALGGNMTVMGDLTVSGTVAVKSTGFLSVNGDIVASGTFTRTAGCLIDNTSVLYASTTSMETSGTGNQQLMGMNLPANKLKAGMFVHIKGGGVTNPHSASVTSLIKLRIGSSYTTIGTLVSDEANNWHVDILVSIINSTSVVITGTDAFTGISPFSVTVDSGIDFTSADSFRIYGNVNDELATITQHSVMMLAG